MRCIRPGHQQRLVLPHETPHPDGRPRGRAGHDPQPFPITRTLARSSSLIDPDRPSPPTWRSPSYGPWQRLHAQGDPEGMTEQPNHACSPPTGNGDDATNRQPDPAHRTGSTTTTAHSPDNPISVRRPGPASRPSGRSAVGLRPSPDPRPSPRRAQPRVGARKTGRPSLLTGPAPSGMTWGFVRQQGLEPRTR